MSLGKGIFLCKFDISDAFKIIPTKPSQWPLYCMKWKSSYYFYVRLSFGCRSSPIIFDNLLTVSNTIPKYSKHVTGPTVLCASIGILSLLNIIVIIAIVLSAIAFGGSTVMPC
jgi:hypothetical protein